MRTALLLLLAGTAAPAIAQPLDSDRAQAREDRREARAERREAARQERRISRDADAEQAPRVRPVPTERSQRVVERFVGTDREDGPAAPRPERRRVAETDAERPSPGVRVIEAPAGGAVERLRRPRLARESISETPEAPRPSRRVRDSVAERSDARAQPGFRPHTAA